MKGQQFKIGDKVKVMDAGLLMLMQFAPPNSKPINECFVSGITEDGMIEVEFPIGDDDIEVHSQVSIYPPNEVQPIK
jgi:hypothetical protein